MNYIKTYEEIDLYKLKQKVKGKLGIQNKKEIFLSKFLYSNPNIQRHEMYTDGKGVSLLIYPKKTGSNTLSKFVKYIRLNIVFGDDVKSYAHIELNNEDKFVNYLEISKSNVIASKDYGCKEDFSIFYEYHGMGGYGFILVLNDYSNIRELDETGSNGYNYDLNDYINSLSKIDYDELLDQIEVSNKDTVSKTSEDMTKYVDTIVDFFIDIEEYGKLEYKYTINKDELSVKLSYKLNKVNGVRDLLDDETFELYKILSTAKKRLKLIGDLISYDHEIFQNKQGGYGKNTYHNLFNIHIKIKIK